MGICTNLATQLDTEMILGYNPHAVFSEVTPIHSMPMRSGHDVFAELGGRWLLRYVTQASTRDGSPVLPGLPGPAWTTPTPYSPEEAVRALALPRKHLPRSFVLLLDPREIQEIQGPRRCRTGRGLEYYLPKGYPDSALVHPWEVEVR